MSASGMAQHESVARIEARCRNRWRGSQRRRGPFPPLYCIWTAGGFHCPSRIGLSAQSRNRSVRGLIPWRPARGELWLLRGLDRGYPKSQVARVPCVCDRARPLYDESPGPLRGHKHAQPRRRGIESQAVLVHGQRGEEAISQLRHRTLMFLKDPLIGLEDPRIGFCGPVGIW
jgi:hypothetical protein